MLERSFSKSKLKLKYRQKQLLKIVITNIIIALAAILTIVLFHSARNHAVHGTITISYPGNSGRKHLPTPTLNFDVTTVAAARGGDAFNDGVMHHLSPPPLSRLPTQKPIEKHYYVLGSVMKMNEEFLSVFLQSWQRHSPQTKIVLFVDNPDAYPILSHFSDTVETLLLPPKRSGSMHVKYHRYFMYHDFIKERQHSIAGILLTDVRDVAIQSDPWSDSIIQKVVDQDGVLFSMEGGPGLGGEVLVGTEGWNARQIEKCFGKQGIDVLKDKVVSCSGITLGGTGGMLLYLSRMMDTIQNIISPECPTSGVGDQTAHNWVLHVMSEAEAVDGGATWDTSSPPPNNNSDSNNKIFLKVPSWYSPIQTSQYGWPLVIDRYSQVERAGGGRRPVIIHQWDRSEQLKKRYSLMYGLWEDEVYEGDRCPLCTVLPAFNDDSSSGRVMVEDSIVVDDDKPITTLRVDAAAMEEEEKEEEPVNNQEEQYTIITPSFKREDLLKQFLDKYAGPTACPSLHSIIISWADVDTPPPSFLTAPPSHYTIPVYVFIPPSSSLNYRFHPPPMLTTEAVFQLDDDIRLRCDDIEFGFGVWKEHRQQIVGFSARAHEANEHYPGGFKYHINPIPTTTTTKNSRDDHRTGYSIILTNAAFLHRHYLQDYWSDTNLPLHSIRTFIDRERNCEDIAMNYLVASQTHLPGVYVQAEEMIHLSSDLNLEGISSMKVPGEKNVHYSKRCRCLGEFTEQFLGVNPLDDAWSDVFYRKG